MQLVNDDKIVVYTLRRGIEDTVIYDENKVEERYGFGPNLIPDFKGLKGDPSDNIIGVKGIGEKTATELIKKFGALENLYKKLEVGGGRLEVGKIVKERVINLLLDHKKDAFFSKELATIRRDAPINFLLPTSHFSLHTSQLKALFEELGFTSLVARLSAQ